MVPGRKLTLRRETLVELTSRELHDVVGAASGTPDCCFTAELLTCLEATLTACPDYYCTGTC